MSIYKEIVARSIPHANHASDLYIPVTEETRALLKQFDITTATTFINQVEGGLWFDVPFAYLPWWKERRH